MHDPRQQTRNMRFRHAGHFDQQSIHDYNLTYSMERQFRGLFYHFAHREWIPLPSSKDPSVQQHGTSFPAKFNILPEQWMHLCTFYSHDPHRKPSGTSISHRRRSGLADQRRRGARFQARDESLLLTTYFFHSQSQTDFERSNFVLVVNISEDCRVITYQNHTARYDCLAAKITANLH